ncbi:hypothetical protein QYE76_030134 [Lolium multiflorum]|uniref:Transposase (putative) gypsy type domain-containing protein n=1 Tax=Lolium multiflorum TaxID=4521 RepID=A0AAD8QQL0_LOLMU|nr:hypothetical protein QYE76_030134 [Lolium multiflorum]
MAAEDLDWERSKISNQDLNLMKKLGLMKKDDAIRFPSEESYPNPPMEYRVSFVDHLIRGLSAPIHDFLRGLLFVYGIQLHQLTPNSILHISIFITLCECFLGVPPNWALWKRIFLLRRNASRNATYNIGGVVICVRTDVEYFDVKFPDSPEVFPSSLSKKSSVPVNFDDSSSMDLIEELKELRVQLQSVKKQSLILMEQSRESSEKEKIALQRAQDAISERDTAVAEADAAASRENSMLQLLTDASLDMAGAFLDPITEDERVEARSNVLLRLAHEHGSTFWGTPERTRQIVRFQDRALQVREYLDFCTRTLSLVYGTMFPRNKMPETLPALMDKFRDAPRIHGFVRAQLAAGARFAMIMIKICYPKLDVGQVVPKCLEKMSKRKRNFGKYDDIVTPVAEDMMDELLRMDSEFFVKGSYAEHSTRAVNNEHLTIDNILGNS